jgi:hypothetical protein
VLAKGGVFVLQEQGINPQPVVVDDGLHGVKLQEGSRGPHSVTLTLGPAKLAAFGTPPPDVLGNSTPAEGKTGDERLPRDDSSGAGISDGWGGSVRGAPQDASHTSNLNTVLSRFQLNDTQLKALEELDTAVGGGLAGTMPLPSQSVSAPKQVAKPGQVAHPRGALQLGTQQGEWEPHTPQQHLAQREVVAADLSQLQ